MCVCMEVFEHFHHFEYFYVCLYGCFGDCNETSGPCTKCGDGGQCCSKIDTGCTTGAEAIAPDDHYSCIGLRRLRGGK